MKIENLHGDLTDWQLQKSAVSKDEAKERTDLFPALCRLPIHRIRLRQLRRCHSVSLELS